MDKSQSPHPTEPILEAILTNQDKNAKSQESVLEAILTNQDSNAKSVEPILEASLIKQDEIVKAIKDKPEVQKIKIVTDESELADNFFRMLRGQKGEVGEKGDKGDKGDKGEQGDKGDKGEQGEIGLVGPKGDKGDKGKDGINGIDGLDGRDGVDGKDGKTGPAGKDGKSIDPKDVKKIAKELNKNNNLFLNIPGVKHVNAGTNITITGTDEEPIINSTTQAGGDVSKVGTPVNNQVGVWTGDGTLEGDANLTFDTTTDILTTGAVSINGTAGAGFIDIVGQSVEPVAPVAGSVRIHGETSDARTFPEFTNESGTMIVLGRDSVVIAKNVSGGAITKGQAVYVFGSSGNTPTIKLAKSDATATILGTIGIIAETTIANNGFGHVVITGVIKLINTSAYTAGDGLYVSATTAGALTNVPPAYPNFQKKVGTIMNVGVGNGSMLINTAPFTGGMEVGTNAPIFKGTGLQLSGLTASELTATDASKNIVSLPVATYPSLTELTYVKGLTSSVQTQLTEKLPLSGGTMTGNITLGENTSIDLDPAGSADGKYSGICITGTAGATLAFGDLIYLAAADSRWELTDADATATSGTPLIGMCVLAAAADGNATKILLHGTIRADAKFPALTIGAPAYVGETAGAIQVAIPTGADNVIRIVGRALTADELYFCPSQDHQITVA